MYTQIPYSICKQQAIDLQCHNKVANSVLLGHRCIRYSTRIGPLRKGSKNEPKMPNSKCYKISKSVYYQLSLLILTFKVCNSPSIYLKNAPGSKLKKIQLKSNFSSIYLYTFSPYN